MNGRVIAGLVMGVAAGALFFSGFAIPAVAIGLIGGILLVSGFIPPAKPSQKEIDSSEYGAEGRSLLRGLTAQRDGIAEIVANHGDNLTIASIGGEALTQADEVIEHAKQMVIRRKKLKELDRMKSRAVMDLNKLKSNLASSTSDSERASLEQAIATRNEEMADYEKASQEVRTIEANIREMEAGLSAAKAKLSIGAARDAATTIESDELRSMLGQLKSLSDSYDEADDILKNRL